MNVKVFSAPREGLAAIWDKYTNSPDDVMGLCPSCGEEIKRKDDTNIRSKVDITPGPTYVDGYRCPNSALGRQSLSGGWIRCDRDKLHPREIDSVETGGDDQ